MESSPAFLEGNLVFELPGFRAELGLFYGLLGLFYGLFQQEPTQAPRYGGEGGVVPSRAAAVGHQPAGE